jgi:hypothetical protein
MTERLLNLFDPPGVGRHARLAGWITGAVAGAIIATVALLLLAGAHIAT